MRKFMLPHWKARANHRANGQASPKRSQFLLPTAWYVPGIHEPGWDEPTAHETALIDPLGTGEAKYSYFQDAVRNIRDHASKLNTKPQPKPRRTRKVTSARSQPAAKRARRSTR